MNSGGTLGAIAITLLLGGCQQVPVTGRSALTLVNHEDVLRAGAVAFEQLKREKGMSRDRAMNDQLQRVAGRLARVAFWDVPDADWEFVVLNAPKEINAHGAAGGKVAITSGFWLWKVIESDDQLAWVVAHEISHLAARHVDERYSRQLVAQGGALATATGLVASGGAVVAQTGLQAYGLSAVLTTLVFDRNQELEADYMALIYMARAGFNPEEGRRVFEKMVDVKSAGGFDVPAGIFSTHPSYPERTLQLIDKLPKALEIYRTVPRAAGPMIVK